VGTIFDKERRIKMSTLSSLKPSISSLPFDRQLAITMEVRFRRRQRTTATVKRQISSGRKVFIGLSQAEKIALIEELGINIIEGEENADA